MTELPASDTGAIAPSEQKSEAARLRSIVLKALRRGLHTNRRKFNASQIAFQIVSAITSNAWQSIETAPRNGDLVLCCWSRGSDNYLDQENVELLRWKTNPRTGRSYFGDSLEMDDYDLADNQPTHWREFRPFPKLQEASE